MNEQLKIIISAEIDKFKKNVDEAKKKINSFGDAVEKAKKDVDANIAKMGEGIKKGLDVGIKAFGAASAAILALGPATAEYRQNQAQLNAAFEQAKLTADSATDTYKQLYKVIGEDDQAVESAANIAMLANSEKEAAKWAELASGVLGTFHDTLQPEAFYEAANETLKLGEATGAFTQMLEQTGVMSVDEFNKKLAECSTEEEKAAFMLGVTETALGSAGEAYDKATTSIQAQREANANLQSTLAAIGEAVAPLVTAFTQFANEALAAVMPHIQAFAETYGPSLVEALTTMGEKTGEIIGWLVDNWELIAGLAGVIGIITAAVTAYNAVAAIKAAMAAAEVTTLGALAAGYMAQAAAMAIAIAPYALIIAAIVAVIAIIVLCVKHWDEIKAKVSEVWEGIKTKTKEAVDNVVNKFSEMKTNFTNKVNEIKTNITNKFEEIKNNMKSKIDSAKQTVLNIFDNIKSGIKEKIEGARDFVKSAIEKIKSFFKFEWSLPKLKLPHVSISGSFSLMPPSVPHFSIAWYAKGGVFDNPTLFPYGGSIGGLGEAGAEAIVPLENNTEWLDKIAERLAEKSGTTPIVLQVDGKTFAQTSISTINQLTRQSGKLELNLY